MQIPKKYIPSAKVGGLILILVIGLFVILKIQRDSFENQVSYNRNIRPLLSDKCFACHGPDANKRKAGLRLDQQAGAYAELKKNKGHYAIVPGDPDKSEIIKRMESTDPEMVMPIPSSHLLKLTKEEVSLFKQWIKAGAKYEKHWAFVPPVKAAVPDVSKKNWSKNEIDNFILQKQKQKGLSPNDQASRETLIKRAFADITGLPPTVQELNRWNTIADKDWYSQLIDSVFKKPAYGEKMAILWCDLARYADSFGFQDDNIRSQWPWRDWVIHAFNSNMSYEKFITDQIAGDLLPKATKENILATGFFRNHKYTEEGGIIPEEYRVSYNVDKTRTFGKAILGVTIECAQCHDHKYDPFSNKDYYQLYAFFNISKEKGFEGDVGSSTPAKTPKLFINHDEVKNSMPYLSPNDTSAIQVSVMADDSLKKPTYMLSRGRYDAPTDVKVSPIGLESIMPYDTMTYATNRLGLAQWTMNKKNPLTARVFVNFIWQEIFGKGIVKTSSDYGLQGELPSHPELLDWLAVDFMDHNWDIQYLIKKIMTSGTYCQSSEVSKSKLEEDSENIYLARAPRMRFKAELVRDWVLSSSGLLNGRIGGPSVKPYQPKGVWESTTSGRGVLASYKQDHGDAIYRRGLYTIFKLTAPPPSLMIFDASSRDQCESKRSSTNTPLQALTMLNDPTVLEASRVLAENITVKTKVLEDQIEQAFQSIIIRKPTRFERNKLLDYCQKQQEYFKQNPDLLKLTIASGEFKHPKEGHDLIETGALMKTILIIYNLEEAITKS